MKYTTRTLIAATQILPPFRDFLRQMFFNQDRTFPTQVVEVQFMRGGNTMAPFIAPRQRSIVVEPLNWTNRLYRPPRVGPAEVLGAEDFDTMTFGESIQTLKSPEQRYNERVESQYDRFDRMISKREEWMCANLLFNGAITCTFSNGATDVITYGSIQTTTLSGTQVWGNNTADVFGALDAARIAIQRASNATANIAIMNGKTARLFINTKQVMDSKIFNAFGPVGTLSTVRSTDGNGGNLYALPPAQLAPFCTLTYPNMSLYAYDALYQNSDGDNSIQQVIPDGMVLVASNEVQGHMAYGSIRQVDGNGGRLNFYEGKRIPKLWTDVETDLVKFQLCARPLPVPNDILTWMVLNVGTGPSTITY